MSRRSHRCQRLSASLLAIGAALLSLAAAASSLATVTPPDDQGITVTGSTTDPDDTLGRLDIARVTDRVSQLDRHHFVLTYRVRTFAAFDGERLEAGQRNFVLELNRDAERGSERNVRVSSDSDGLVAEVISNATREVIATVDVTRPNEQSIRISGPRRILGARSYFWSSTFHAPRSADCGHSDGFPITCQDSVPQHGWIRLDSPAWPDVD